MADRFGSMQSRGPGTPDDPAQFTVDRDELVELVDEIETPATLDRVADVVFRRRVRANALSKSWYDIHGELYCVDLPHLDSAGQLEFDEERGLVDSTDT